MRSWYRADQSGFDEGTPLVHQHSLASNIILAEKTETQYTQSIKHSYIFVSKHTVSIHSLYNVYSKYLQIKAERQHLNLMVTVSLKIQCAGVLYKLHYITLNYYYSTLQQHTHKVTQLGSN